MRAVIMTAVGGPDVLQLAELPEPAIAGARDVRVRVLAAGINPVDFHLDADARGVRLDLGATRSARRPGRGPR